MSKSPHDGWPAEGSVWEHWSDLLPPTLLAALREGYTGISKAWQIENSQHLKFRCKIRACSVREYTCQESLLHAVAENPQDLAGRWVVKTLRIENLDVRQHSKHTAGVGVSRGFDQPPSKKPKLSIGRTVQDWRSMHLLEGSIRTEARRDGHFLDTWSRSKEYLSSSKHEFSYFFACVSGQKCSFYLRFGPHNQEKEEGWICEQLCLTHTCSSIAPAISEELLKRLAFWPKPKIRGIYTAPTNRQISGREIGPMSKTDQHLGDYPVLAPGQTSPRQVLPLPAAQIVQVAEESTPAQAQRTTSENRQALISLKNKLNYAMIMDDPEEVKIVKRKIAEMEQAEMKEAENAKEETVSNKKQRTLALLESLEENPQALKKSKSNPSSKQPLPPAPLPIPSTTPTSSTSPDTAQTDKLQNRQQSLVKAIDSLFSIRRLILDLDHKVSTALALDDLEGAGNYEAEKLELEKRRDDIQGKVTKQKRKVERQKEKMKAKQMIEKKVVKNTSDSPKVKQARKVKKSKKEKKMQ